MEALILQEHSRLLSSVDYISRRDAILYICERPRSQRFKLQVQPHSDWLLTRYGINYDKPLTPMEIVAQRGKEFAACSQGRPQALMISSCHGSHMDFDYLDVFLGADTLNGAYGIQSSRQLEEYKCQKPTPSSSESNRSDDSTSDWRIGCCVCFDDVHQISSSDRHLMATFCGHIFCNSCIDGVVKNNPVCPVCRKKIIKKYVHKIYL